MPTPINCCVEGMWSSRGRTLDRYGLDQTGKIQYRFNNQGFRADHTMDFVPDYAFFGCSFVAGIGVPIEQTFASFFPCSHNYGVCGKYLNSSIFEIIRLFANSEMCHEKIKMAVFWTNRDQELLDQYYQELNHLPLLHFFCGTLLPRANCYAMIKNLDWDVSNTHIGPRTHKFLYQTLCALFDRL